MRIGTLEWRRGYSAHITATLVVASALVSALATLSIGGCSDSSATAPGAYSMTITLQPAARTVAAGDSVTVGVVARATTAGTLPLTVAFVFEAPSGIAPRVSPCASYGPRWAWLLSVGYGDYVDCATTIAVAPTVAPGAYTVALVGSAKGFSEARATIALTVIAAP